MLKNFRELSPWVPVSLFALNWTYLIVFRPEFDAEGKLPPRVYDVQIVVMAILAALMLAVLWPKISTWGMKIFVLGLLLDGIGMAIFMNVDHGIYFDTIGTVLVGVLLGPTAGALNALVAQAVLALVFPAAIPFYMINMVVGWGAGLLARMGGFGSKVNAVLTGLLLGTIAGIVAIPLMSLGYGSDPTLFHESPAQLLRRVFGVFLGGLVHKGATSDPLDKALVCLLVSFLIPSVMKVVEKKK